jgi:hypothetical protein
VHGRPVALGSRLRFQPGHGARTRTSPYRHVDNARLLLATGRTNRQIADGLHLSVKTVERHLSNLYRKLGVSNRTEAVTAAIQSIADSRDVSWSWDVEGKH